MARCPSCAEVVPDGAKFCPECGTPLTASALEPRRERKIVSVVFVDLAGFTARSHAADPEDVSGPLRAFHAQVKRQIEHYGGTLDKFIGDGVLGVFGTPVAHEDDAERSVRAALRIVSAVDELNEGDPALDLAVRVAVNTGEAVVAVERGARTEESVVGDVVNTASRLEQVAPVGGVIVGEGTYLPTRDCIRYEELDPVHVKGKPDPLSVWRALSPVSRHSMRLRPAPTPFIGRRYESDLLESMFQRTVTDRTPHLITLTGEPGVGKSRIVAELAARLDARDEMIMWRQGRSLPYGEGVTFWALGEIVKTQSGILESDSLEDAAAKLHHAVATAVNRKSDAEWIEKRLAPLVGTSTSVARAERDESFTAWSRFLEALAMKKPLVAVFEDLHWAGSAMLDFIDHMMEWLLDVPLFVICTARPELYERHPEWGGGNRNATTLSLSPLNDEETAELISALLEQGLLPAELQSTLIERAGGNPLYAEEFIRMLADRGALVRKGEALDVRADDDIPLPYSLQALIAARLDTVAPERKSLLQTASVAGEVFWAGAVSSVSDVVEDTVLTALQELVRKDLIRPIRESSIAGEAEFSFRHALIKDVCYEQIPRAARARKHRDLASWLAQVSGERVRDHAELLAHHYLQALHWGRRTRTGGEDVAELEKEACKFLVIAGDRALQLDWSKGEQHYGRALDLLGRGDLERPRLLVQAGLLSFYLGLFPRARERLEEAASEYESQGNRLGQGEALATLGWVLAEGAQEALSEPLFARAIEILEGEEPGNALCSAYVRMAWIKNFAGSFDEALEWAEKGVALANELGGKEALARALGARGDVLCELGRLEGLQDLNHRLELARSLDLPGEIAGSYINLGDWTWWMEGPLKGLEFKQAAIDFARRRGLSTREMWAQAESVWMSFDLGHWDKVLEDADEVISWDLAHGGSRIEALALPNKVRVLWNRGLIDDSAELEEHLISLAHDMLDVQVLIPALPIAALIRGSLGDTRTASAYIEEWTAGTDDKPAWRARYLPEVVRFLCGTDRRRLAERSMIKETEVSMLRDRHSAFASSAVLLEAQGHLEDAASGYMEAATRWRTYGFVLEEGHALLGAGRTLLTLGDADNASESLRSAKAIFSRLGAEPLRREVDRHLRSDIALDS